MLPNQAEQKLSLNLGIISASIYVAFQLLANVLSTKIALIPFTSFATDGGTIIYPLTFTLRDFVHKSLGKVVARQVVILAGAISVISALLFWFVGQLTPDPSWTNQGAYELILTPLWRITIASVIAQVISELIDTEIFSKVIRKFSDTKAVFLSNLVALVVDSILFSALAFAGTFPWNVVVSITLTNLGIKLVMSIITTPAIKLVPRKVAEEQL